MKRILVVDDMSSIRSLIKAVIYSFGKYIVEEAPNGVSALQKMKLEKYDLVISDWNMPEMSGHRIIASNSE